jgi:beta-glucosidase
VYLQPGESRTVRFELTGHELSYWDDTANGWVLPDGAFSVYVGDSSALANLPLQGSFSVTRSVGARYATLTTPSAAVNPGSAIPVSATFTNDGDYPTGQGIPSLQVPPGWTVTSGTRQPVALAPGQSATENWTVAVPVGADGTTASLTASLTQAGRAIGNLATSATVTVNPALTVSSSTPLVGAGGQAAATLTVTSNLPGPAVLSYATSPPAGVTVVPAQGSVVVPAGGTTTTVDAAAAPDLAPGSYPVLLDLGFTDQGRRYSLAPAQIPVVVPYASVAAAFSNIGISDDTDTDAASFDGDGSSFSAQALASVGVTQGASLSYDGITFTWPDVAAGQPDNVVGSGQTIALSGQGTELGFLDSSTYGVSSGSGTIYYTDGSTQTFSLSVDDWYKAAPAGSNAVIVVPYRNTPGNVQDHTVTNVFEQSVPLQPGKTVAAVTLPDISPAAADGVTTLHVFAIAVGG